MDATVRLNAFSRTSCAVASVILLAGFAACGGLGTRPVAASSGDAALPPVWPAEVTVSSCDDFSSLAVGSYVVQSNYWNKTACPGTQCMEVNSATGAFSVTQGPGACGDTVASYPNVLYGCSYGNCSPDSTLPMPVSTISTVTSSWDFSAGGTAKDRYNVAYDIWFCPDDNCGSSGFPKGLELMIWLDYKNVHGWKTNLGSKTIAGYTFDVWVSDMLAGQATTSWTDLTYILRSPQVTSVTDLDLNAFFKDAKASGYMQDSWYFYAIQAGMEVRSGGMPFTSNSFSVSINGVTPSTAPIPYAGPSCDGGVPTGQGQMSVTGNYVTAGPLHGYGSSWASAAPGSNATACGTPAFGPSALCTAGTITADLTYNSTAGIGFNLNQDVGADGGAGVPGTITIPNSITVSVTKSGTLTGNSALRVQLTDANGIRYCYGGPMTDAIPIGKFNSKCWNNTGDFATSSTLFTKLEVMVPSSASTEQKFAYCLTNVAVE